jgi:methyl-accepting chemotaxis protein/methyl-accepting chemotaxis protein-1 (serine sensor receptor)
MTLEKKYLTGIGSMLVMSLVLGITSLSSISKLTSRLDASHSTGRRIQLAGDIDSAGSDMLAGQRGMIMFALVKNPERVEKARQLFDRGVDVWQRSIEDFRSMPTSEEARNLIDQLQSNLQGWKAAKAEMDRLITSGTPEAAVDVAVQAGVPLYEAHARACARLRQLQDELYTQDADDVGSLATTSRWIAGSLLFLSFILGTVVVLVVRKTTGTLSRAASELSQTAEQVATASTQISSSSRALAQGVSQQAASITETSASAEEITTMTRRNADHSRSAAELMVQTSAVVVDANRMLEQMQTSMRDINTSSDKIGEIIKVIDGIAFQTNILALNAAVEAARAGDAGMGFAVVADEVRNLAQRSAQAAQDTAGLIEESIKKSGEGSTKLDQLSSTIRAITERSDKVRKLIDEVHVGSEEQSRGVEQIAKAMTQMEQVTQASAASAEQAATAGESMSAQAVSMRKVVVQLEELVGAGIHTARYSPAAGQFASPKTKAAAPGQGTQSESNWPGESNW